MKTGIFGGVFSPPHAGHIIPLVYLLNEGLVDRIEVIPCLQQPLKETHNIPYELRMQMAEEAYRDIPGIHVNSIEKDMPMPSYTINTIRAMNLAEPYLIIGYDQAENIEKWHQYEALKNEVEFILIRRDADKHDIDEVYFSNAVKADNPIITISSTMIRSLIRDKKSIEAYVPDEVIQIIKSKGLYSEKTVSS